MRRLLVVAVLSALVLAGCSGKSAQDETPKTGEGEVPAGEAATLHGVVFTDAGLVLKGARILLVGDDSYEATSDIRGVFNITGIRAGEYLLRVEASGFHVYEETIELAVAAALEVEVTMIPKDTGNPNYRPHVHDYWRGRTEVDLATVVVDIAESRVGTVTADAHPLLNYASAVVLYGNTVFDGLDYVIPLDGDGDEPRIIFPGTAKIEITFTWDDAPPYPPIYSLRYEAPVADSTQITTDPGPSGTTWTIDVTPEMADNGHQTFSLWEFFIRPANDIRGDTSTYRPAVADHEVTVDFKLIKGDEPLPEPPHPRFWENGTQVPVVLAEDSARSKTPPPPIPSKFTWRPLDGRIVPPGTGVVRAELTWAADDIVPAPLEPYDLYYSPGNVNPIDRPYTEYVMPEPTVDEPGRRVYEILVGEGESDAFYQQRSSWRFAAFTGDDPTAPEANIHRARTVTLDVVAIQAEGAGVE